MGSSSRTTQTINHDSDTSSTRTSGLSLNNLTVSGVTGLTSADIPDLSARYLSTAGGTISGNLTITGSFNGAALTLANASTTLLSVLGPAYFGATATSTFGTDGSLTLAGALINSSMATSSFAGAVGIGTTTPLSNVPGGGGRGLSVSGQIAIGGGTGTAHSLRLEDTTGTSRNALYIDANNYMVFGNSNFAGTYIPSGNVGIGTTTPPAKLTVAGNGTGYAFLGSNGCGSNFAALTLGQNVDTDCTGYTLLAGAGNTIINTPTNGSIFFRVANATKMVMDTNGNVGIGTTTPQIPLEVNGGARIQGTQSPTSG